MPPTGEFNYCTVLASRFEIQYIRDQSVLTSTTTIHQKVETRIFATTRVSVQCVLFYALLYKGNRSDFSYSNYISQSCHTFSQWPHKTTLRIPRCTNQRFKTFWPIKTPMTDQQETTPGGSFPTLIRDNTHHPAPHTTRSRARAASLESWRAQESLCARRPRTVRDRIVRERGDDAR